MKLINTIENRESLVAESYIPFLLMIFFSIIYISIQYISIDYTAIFFGGIEGYLFAFAIAITALYLWYELHKAKKYWLKILLLTALLLLSIFNYYTVLKTQISKTSQKIESSDVTTNDPFLSLYLKGIKQQSAEIKEIRKSIKNKEDKLLKLQTEKRISLKDIDDDYKLQINKCRKRKCRNRVNSIRTHNKTSINNSFKLQQSSFLNGLKQLNTSLIEKEDSLKNLKEKMNTRIQDIQYKQQNKLNDAKNDKQNNAFAILIVFFSELSSFVFFRSYKDYNSLKKAINHIDQEEIISESSASHQKLTLLDLKKKIESEVQEGTFKHLGQRKLFYYAKARIISGKFSQGRAKKWIEQWEQKNWVVVERDSERHWISVRYPTSIRLVYEKSR